jgi:hypothetical protein
MEIKISSSVVLNMLHVLAWIIFIGLCIEAGGILFNTVYACYKPIVAARFWNGADLSALYALDKGFFVTQTAIIAIATVLKAMLFYTLVLVFYKKEFDFAKPFNPAITKAVFRMAWCSLGVAFFSLWGAGYARHMASKGIAMPHPDLLRIGGGDVWLFMAVVLLVIGYVFKKGTELQTENDLTV